MFQMVLKQLRERDKLSQVQLARLLEVSQSTVGMWESGRNKPTYAMLGKIAGVFGVPVGMLVEDAPAALASEAAGYATAPIIAMPDDSMAPEILRGDQLTLRPTQTVNRGDIIAFVRGGKTCVRYVTLNGETVAASARDVSQPPVVFQRGKEKEAEIQLLGRVVELRRRLGK